MADESALVINAHIQHINLGVVYFNYCYRKSYISSNISYNRGGMDPINLIFYIYFFSTVL